jgi:hypothetical protein
MNLIQLTTTREALRQSLQRYEQITVCCHSCEHYGNETARQCSIHKATPPPEWMKGPIECADWLFDQVPF